VTVAAVKGPTIYGAVVVLSLALFLLVPGIDTAFSRVFYSSGSAFWLATWPPLQWLAGSIRWITWGIVLIAVTGWLWLWLTGKPLWRLDRKALIFIVAATAIGPGIIVNTVLKDHWGRARPAQIEAFGGIKHFTPAPLPADQCARNCAFVSGHAALGFSLVSFALLLPAGRARRNAIAVALAFGGLVGLGRIAAGGHFLSDVVDAGLIVFGVSWLLHRWLVMYDGFAQVTAWTHELSQTPGGHRILWAVGIIVGEAASIIWIDRPLADFFHAKGAPIKPFFAAVERFGLGWPYLVLSAAAFAVLRWGGSWEKLRPRAAAMREAAVIPGFFFAAIGASGLVVDLLKVIVGRTRPKLLFATGTYDFGWFGLRPDDWSFPSGHAATAAALMAALWCLWPRPLWLYVFGAMLVAVSRVVTGAHYLSDVVAGAVIAVLVTRAIAAWLLPLRLAWRVEREAARRCGAV
jgi:lipid A 4'-phosphatase